MSTVFDDGTFFDDEFDDDDIPPVVPAPVIRASPLYLVTFREAKAQVELDHDLSDDMINKQRADASSVVLNYIKIDIGASSFNWVDLFGEPIADNIPGEVSAAVKLMIGAFFENRDGDVWRSPQPISQPVMDLLWRHRDPAMA